MLSKCATKALIALRDYRPDHPLDHRRLASTIGSAPHDARSAILELESAGEIAIETRPDCRRYVTIKPAPPQSHRVTVEGEAGEYAVTGAVAIQSTKHPVLDASRALKLTGAPDSDIIVVAGNVVSTSPTTIGAVLNYRPSHARRALEKQPYGEARFNS